MKSWEQARVRMSEDDWFAEDWELYLGEKKRKKKRKKRAPVAQQDRAPDS